MLDEEMLDQEEGEDSVQQNKYLLFPLSGEMYGVGIESVVNIVEMQKITAVPDVPPYIKGLINLRGNILPVVDLRLRFNLPPREYDDRTCIVVLRSQEKTFGVIVDTVAEVQEIPPEAIDPPQLVLGGTASQVFLKGIGKVGDSIRLLLDVDRILGQTDLENIPESVHA